VVSEWTLFQILCMLDRSRHKTDSAGSTAAFLAVELVVIVSPAWEVVEVEGVVGAAVSHDSGCAFATGVPKFLLRVSLSFHLLGLQEEVAGFEGHSSNDL